MDDNLQKLREKTGAGVMDCKKALEEAKGDFEKAVKVIEKKGIANASKKSDRKTSAGLLEAYIHAGKVGVLLDIRCETDFVARTENFKKLAHEIAMHIAAMNPENIDTLLKENYIRDPNTTIEELIKREIIRLGENIKIERFCRYET